MIKWAQRISTLGINMRYKGITEQQSSNYITHIAL